MLRRPIAFLAGIGVMAGLNFIGDLIFDAVALPDLCDYHNKDVETGWLFDLFFPQTAINGFHPGPGLFFMAFVLACGIAAGILAHRLMRNT